MKYILYILLIIAATPAMCQLPKTQATTALYDGFIVAGYVDHGAFINFGGPSVRLKNKITTWLLGMLPSLRIKKDIPNNLSLKNSTTMPALGAGFTFICNKIVFQLPVYYTTKTTATSGK